MAITGTGTELDPWIVHSYDEIKEAAESHNTGDYTMYYMKLANDIDCNDYGADWEWTVIEFAKNTGSGSSLKRWANTLDLDGHSIKNAFVANGEKMFAGIISGTTGYGIIKNGKILNIFGSNPYCIFPSMYLNNVSVSSQLTSYGDRFSTGFFQNCAIYLIVLQNGSKTPFYYSQNNALKNVDIYVELLNCTSGAQLISPGGAVTLDSIRISGKATPADPNNLGSFKISNQKLINSVVDFDLTEWSYPEGTTGTVSIIVSDGNNTTVANAEKLQVAGYQKLIIPSGIIQATTAQIRNGDNLRSLGFLVANVEE